MEASEIDAMPYPEQARRLMDLAAHDIPPEMVTGDPGGLAFYAAIRRLEPMFDKRRTSWSDDASDIRLRLPRWSPEHEAIYGEAIRKATFGPGQLDGITIRYLESCGLRLGNVAALWSRRPPVNEEDFAIVLTVEQAKTLETLDIERN